MWRQQVWMLERQQNCMVMRLKETMAKKNEGDNGDDGEAIEETDDG